MAVSKCQKETRPTNTEKHNNNIINVKEKFQLRLGSYAVNSRNLQLPIKGEPNLCVPLKWRTLRDHNIM